VFLIFIIILLLDSFVFCYFGVKKNEINMILCCPVFGKPMLVFKLILHLKI